MRWLHLSDLHVGRADQSQEVALNSIVDAVNDHAESKAFDVVVLTGDLAYSGKAIEYEHLEQLLVLPLRGSLTAKNSVYLSVPGNHDIDCGLVLPTPWPKLDEERQNKFFHLTDEALKLRAPRARGFAAYSDFLKRCNVGGVDPLAAPAKLDRIEFAAGAVAFLTVVTSYFSDKNVSDREQTPAPLHPVRYLLQQAKHAGGPLFILGHHPSSWFTHDTKEKFASLLDKENAVYLHGHEHRVRTDYGPKGLISLGFGAGYQLPSEITAPRKYTNSFAICEFDDSLHVKIVSWSADAGRWKEESDLPAGFEYRSDRIRDGYVLALPTTKQSDRIVQGGFRNVFYSKHSVSGCLWLVRDERAGWMRILSVIGLFSVSDKTIAAPPMALPPGHLQFRVVNSDGTHLVRAVSAHGDVIHEQTVQLINTAFDTSAPTSCAVVTLGEIGEEARTLLTRLAERKAIEFRDGTEIGDALLKQLPAPVLRDLSSFEKTSVSLTLLILDDGIGVLVKDRLRGQWFRLYDPRGAVVEEASELTSTLRRTQPELEGVNYRGIQTAESATQVSDVSAPEPAFDLANYLERCHSLFNDVRYAPLAALGFRFSNATLTDLYIPANANLGLRETRVDEALQRALTEFLESLNLETHQKELLERQMRSSYGLGDGAEVGAAQQLYQRYGNVAVTGDPGSGKTCFVKREILSYCQRDGGEDGWYSKHLPVYVPLVEASRLLSEHKDLLTICAVVSARNALNAPKSAILDHLSRGHLAIFFDGLDEVATLDDRIKLLSLIRELIESFGKLGNRFVLTSRPAALQPVDIPKGVTHLRLSGLTEPEIRLLARRVVSFRLIDTTQAAADSEANELVDRLIEDTRGIPGIGRLARNPLLLTLLVLVYASSGSLYARRHVIYSQAVKTLVSVRNRPLKTKVLSESDLRQRLGRLALAIYHREIGEIPTRSEVLAIFAPYMASRGDASTVAAADFLREVADETGILVIHPRAPDEDVISFMHHSFLEYYAAVGMLDAGDLSDLSELAGTVRWRDIVTLLVGILSEQRDVTAVIRAIAENRDKADEITAKRLIFAFDCALECDVPPEATQQLLAELVAKSIETGPARLSSTLRVDLGRRIGQLYVAAGGHYIRDLLVKGMNHDEPVVAAAYIDLVAHLGEDVEFERGIAPFEAAFARKESAIRIACTTALQTRLEFRTENAIELLRQGLRGNLTEKFTSLRTIEAIGGFMERLWEDVIPLLDDRSGVIANLAANCILGSGMFDHEKAKDRPVLERALRAWRSAARPQQPPPGFYAIEKTGVVQMLASGDPSTVETGIRYMGFLRHEERFVYQQVMAMMRRTADHRIRTACLQVLHAVPDALALITLADTDFLCSLLDAKERDVRLATIRVLGELSADEQVIQSLENHARAASNQGDVEAFSEAMEALGKHQVSQEFAEKRVGEVISGVDSGFGDKESQELNRNVLRITGELDVLLPYRMTRDLKELSGNFRVPKPLRIEAIKAFGALSEPSMEVAKHLVTMVQTSDHEFRHAGYAACASFVSHCRKKVEYVRAVYTVLPQLMESLTTRWDSETRAVRDRIDDRAVADLRKSIVEIQSILSSHEEFADRLLLDA